MEPSPLTLVYSPNFPYGYSLKLPLQAQTHARRASKANNPTAAIDEHDLAAGQFATAAKSTDNSEVPYGNSHGHPPRLIYG